MTDQPYTDRDLRHEAARQYAEVLRAPDRDETRDEMQSRPIPSRSSDEPFLWNWLTDDDLHDAANEVHQLLDGAPDVSEWAVNLGADGLTDTLDMGWSCTTSARDLAVQIAHRKQIKPELLDELESAVRLAVERVLVDHGHKPRLT